MIAGASKKAFKPLHHFLNLSLGHNTSLAKNNTRLLHEN